MTDTETTDLTAMGRAARKAYRQLSVAPTEQKNRALKGLQNALIAREDEVIAANREDLAAAEAAGMGPALLDRLSLQGRVEGMADDVANVIRCADPVGEVFDERTLDNGLHVSKQRTAIGVLGIIYEARPNVTVDVAVLAIKSGNCAILRGGKEAFNSTTALGAIIRDALLEAQLPTDAIQVVASPERERVAELLRLHEYVDMIIPRGGAQLHQFCRENSTIPVITGGIGVCHLFVDSDVDFDKAIDVIINAKTQRPTVCNALDTALVHKEIAKEFLPKLQRASQPLGVTLSCDDEAYDILHGKDIRRAQEEEWDREWLALTLGIKVVDGIDDAIAHVQRHSSGHSDGILTNSAPHADRFVEAVDSAAVYVNASTRFTDGAQLGLGAEVAISTQKLHARGPMGLEELTSYKWVIRGNMHVRK